MCIHSLALERSTHVRQCPVLDLSLFGIRVISSTKWIYKHFASPQTRKLLIRLNDERLIQWWGNSFSHKSSAANESLQNQLNVGASLYCTQRTNDKLLGFGKSQNSKALFAYWIIDPSFYQRRPGNCWQFDGNFTFIIYHVIACYV